MADLLPFGITFLIGAGIGRILKWPLRGVLMSAGVLVLALILLYPGGPLALMRELGVALTAQALQLAGYPEGWARLLFTPEWARVVNYIAHDLAARAQGGIAADPAGLALLGRQILSRVDLAFLLGMLAGARF